MATQEVWTGEMGEASLAGVSIVRGFMVQRVSPQVLSPSKGLVAARILARVFLHGGRQTAGPHFRTAPDYIYGQWRTISVRGRLL